MPNSDRLNNEHNAFDFIYTSRRAHKMQKNILLSKKNYDLIVC